MTDLVLTTAARAAMADGVNTTSGRTLMFNGLLAKADAGVNPSTIEVYGTTQPATVGDPPGGDPLVVLVLTRPAGTAAGGICTLTQESVIGDLIAGNGTAVWARWVGDGVPLADGPVTDETGDGPFILVATEDLALYAGGRARLGVVTLT